ncbi:MAG: hypothetical protein ABL888_20235 [Pirellulaceae bacterium]
MPKRYSTIQHTGGGFELIVPMCLPYHPVPAGLNSTLLGGLVATPLWILGGMIVRKIWNLKPPPRARFIVEKDWFRADFVSQRTGEKSHLECAPVKIVELRKNQFVQGLFIRVVGVVQETFLEDIDDETINSISKELRTALGLHSV